MELDKKLIDAHAEIVVLTVENKKLRKMLASCYVGTALYADDGELQDNREQPFIDFKRDSVDEIVKKMHQRVVAILQLEKEKKDEEINES